MIKERLGKLAHELIEEEFRPHYVKQPRKNDKFNYIADIYTKWVRNGFYFFAEYRSPCLENRSAKYEVKFARLEYLSSGKTAFALKAPLFYNPRVTSFFCAVTQYDRLLLSITIGYIKV